MKNKIYIDFEAISLPMSYFANTQKWPNFPYAFSMLNLENEEIFSYIVNFNKIKNENEVNIFQKVLKNIKDVIEKKLQKWNIEKPHFISWNGYLEKIILEKLNLKTIYKLNDQIKISNNFSPSLKISSIGYEGKKYFSYVKKNIPKIVLKKFNLKESDLILETNDGKIASIAGGLLLIKNHNIFNKSFSIEKIDLKTIEKEINEYSKDDVIRMLWIKKNKKIALKMINESRKYNFKKIKLFKDIQIAKNILENIDDENLSLKKLKIKLLEKNKNNEFNIKNNLQNNEFISENFLDLASIFIDKDEEKNEKLLKNINLLTKNNMQEISWDSKIKDIRIFIIEKEKIVKKITENLFENLKNKYDRFRKNLR